MAAPILSAIFNKIKYGLFGFDVSGNTSPNTPLAATGVQFTSTNGTVYWLTVDNAGNAKIITTTAPAADGDGVAVATNIPAGGITSAMIDPSVRQKITVSLTSAQIKALNATPVSLIAAQGVGKTIIIDEILFTMVTTATQYANGSAVTFQYHGGSAVANTIANTVVNAGAGTSYTDRVGKDVTALANTAVEVTAASTEFDTGTGTATVDIVYRVV